MPKRINSEGIACQNQRCSYFGCGVVSIHGMVSNGCRGRTDSIRRWMCQACGATVTECKDTVLYRPKTRPQRIFEVMTLLANGLDPSAGSRVFRHDDRTILGFSGKVQTAYVERANLTLREPVAALARRTWSITPLHESLMLAIQWSLCYYHFMRPHESLRRSRVRQTNTGDGCGIDRSHMEHRTSAAKKNQSRLTVQTPLVKSVLIMPRVC